MKYIFEEKLRTVSEVFSNYRGLNRVARDLGTHHEHLRRRVKLYEEFGEDGLRPKHGSYSGDFKLSVITTMHENHLSSKEAAVKFGIPGDSTVLKWERIYRSSGVVGLYQDNRGRKRMQFKSDKSKLKTRLKMSL